MYDREVFGFVPGKYSIYRGVISRGNLMQRLSLTQHVPVRFPATTVEAVRELAEADGVSVSAWIRRTVERAVNERTAAGESPSDARVAVERLQRDLADLAAALERSESR